MDCAWRLRAIVYRPSITLASLALGHSVVLLCHHASLPVDHPDRATLPRLAEPLATITGIVALVAILIIEVIVRLLHPMWRLLLLGISVALGVH